MEPKNRNIWIIVAVVVLVIACCCTFVAAVGAFGWFTSRYADVEVEPFDLDGLNVARIEETFEVSAVPTLDITNFAGTVTIRSGEGELVRIAATKKAPSVNKLDRIEVGMSEANDRVTIKTKKFFDKGNASVDLEITAPPGSRVKVNNGAGEVDVQGITGQIDIHSGAGEVSVHRAEGPVQVDLGAGQITYEGAPKGDCRFQSGAGEIVLKLPASPDVRIDLGTALGGVNVEFDVDGRVSARSAEGVIGDGRQGSIFARTGVGSVSVIRQ